MNMFKYTVVKKIVYSPMLLLNILNDIIHERLPFYQ